LFKNNVEDESDFCEAYKAEILNGNTSRSDSSFGSLMLKILAGILLISIITAISIYTYNYFLQTKSSGTPPPVSMQTIDDDDLIVEMEDEAPTVEEEVVIENKEPEEEENLVPEVEIDEESPPSVLPPKVQKIEQDEPDIEKIANNMKIEIAKKEEAERQSKGETTSLEEKEEKMIEVPLSDGESSYVEELAKLVQEVDK
jgi:hypothetical protein